MLHSDASEDFLQSRSYFRICTALGLRVSWLALCVTRIRVCETELRPSKEVTSTSFSSHFTSSSSQLAILFALRFAVTNLDNDMSFVLVEARQNAGGRDNSRDRQRERERSVRWVHRLCISVHW